MAGKKSKAVTMKKPVEDEEASTSSEEVANGESSSSDASMSDGGEQSDGEDASMDDASNSDEESVEGKADSSSPIITSDNNEQCTFDLANLLAINTHQVNAAELYGKNAVNSIKEIHREWYSMSEPTISAADNAATSQLLPPVNESLLLAKAAEGTTQLLRELWKLQTEKTDVGPLAKLPSVETKLPRSLPPPAVKKLSKWEEFALQRGIEPKTKQSRKVFDDDTGEWKHLTGSLQNKANAGPESWPIIEVKKNDDPMADPWEKLREEKKGRVNKNVENRMRNAEREGTLDKGSANRLVKHNSRLEKQRDIAKDKDRARGLVAPVGIPMDFKGDQKRGKPSTQLALRATQVSTASLGKFDKQREGEPEKKLSKSIHGDKKRKQQYVDGSGPSSNKKPMSEAQKSVDILERVMNGSSSKEKERDVKKGKYARGETGHDFDFDDGLGPGSFKKKKVRISDCTVSIFVILCQ